MGPARPLRIAHVTATFPPYWGGTGNVAWHNAHELARLGHEVHVFTAGRGGEKLAPEGVQVHWLRPLVRIGNAPLLPTLLPALRRFDLVHLHYPFFFGAELVRAASRVFGIPYVTTYHNALIGDGSRAPLFAAWERTLGHAIRAGSSRVIAVSLDHAMAQPWFARLPRNKTIEVPNGVDLDLFRPSANGRRVRQKLGIGPDTSLVLFVAALDRAHHFKGLTRLLEALRERPDPAIHLLVVGDGDQRGVYQAQAEAWQLRPRVHFVGAVPQSDLPPYLAAADLLALPTSPPESFGMVLIEAMACGTPVIASDIPGVRDVVRRTGGGLLVPPHDARALATALVEGLRDRQHLVELGAAGRRAVEAAFHWQRIGLQLDSLYRDVLGTEPARPPAQTTGVATQ